MIYIASSIPENSCTQGDRCMMYNNC